MNDVCVCVCVCVCVWSSCFAKNTKFMCFHWVIEIAKFATLQVSLQHAFILAKNFSLDFCNTDTLVWFAWNLIIFKKFRRVNQETMNNLWTTYVRFMVCWWLWERIAFKILMEIGKLIYWSFFLTAFDALQLCERRASQPTTVSHTISNWQWWTTPCSNASV